MKLVAPESEYHEEAVDRFRALCEGRKLIANVDQKEGQLLHLRLIGLIQFPDRVAGMTEDPEVVSTNIAQFLQVRLVDPRNMELLNETMR